MATTHITTPPKPGFLTISGEIRNAIYRMLLTKPYAYQQKAVNYAPLYPAILRTNRQIHSEAVNILHGENIWIIAKINAASWPLILPLVPNVSKKDAGKIKYPALHINFAIPTITEVSQPHMTLIMGEESIEYFLKSLWIMSYKDNTVEEFKASSLNLTLCETPFHKKSELQSICLKPFGLVCGLRNLTIQGQVEPACVQEILHRAESGLKDVAQIENVSQDHLYKGNEAYDAGKPRRALAQYANGSEFLKQVLFLKLEGLSHQPVFEDIITLMARLNVMDTFMARATLAVSKYEEAKTLGERIFKYSFLPKQARVYMALCTARAHRALGEGEDESRLFEEALADGDESTVLAALAFLFPNAAPEQARLLVEQRGKLEGGEAIDIDVIRAFWEAV